MGRLSLLVMHTLLLALLLSQAPITGPHHALEVSLDPATGRLGVADVMTFPGTMDQVEFLLHAKLEITRSTPEVQEISLGDVSPFLGINASPSPLRDTALKRYRVRLPLGMRSLSLAYRGVFDFPLGDEKEEYTRGFRETPGAVRQDGIYLAGHGFWYPNVGAELVTFSLNVTLPEGWHVVAPGKGTSRDATGHALWESEGPTDEMVLTGGPLVRYEEKAGPLSAEVYLREKDDGLAAKYLAATAQYTKMYADLLGPYPYSKFALVENFWETGYGMPSFTLLGSQIIRFPFIINSSYPHEILHNWWGNSVFVDYASGNWCEGLTAYMADHLIAEQRGQGEEHRRAALQRYRDFVGTGSDFALKEFRSRHSAATEAVGYGKTMMGFHMLRRLLGDDLFSKWAARFYADFRGRKASFGDVRESMEAASSRDLTRFFGDWIDRTGAARLAVRVSPIERAADRFLVRGVLTQTQAEPPFALEVPVVLQTEGEPVTATVALADREAAFTIETAARPLALHVDPSFDLFRRLDERETPPSIGQIFGENSILAVLPSAASPKETAAWRALVEGWRSESHQPELRTDAEVTDLPADRSVWILGGANRLATRIEALPAEASLDGERLTVAGESVPRAGHTLVLTVRNTANAAHGIGWIIADPQEALPGLMRKLPHYGKYSYLAFRGAEPTNVMKGQWTGSDSPLRVDLRAPGERSLPLVSLAPPARKALADLPPLFSQSRMGQTVEWLAAPEREGRGIGTQGLEAAAERIAKEFRELGLAPGGDSGDFYQRFKSQTSPDGTPSDVANIIGVLRGTRTEWAGQSVVVGAHYDHLGRGWPDVHEGDAGTIHPGADDNASGVAVLLELARALASSERPQRSIVFVAFTGEEAGRLGSRHYLERPIFPVEKIIGMINLDAVGRLGAGKISVLSAGTADEWQHIFRGASYVTGVDSRIIMESQESSDQKSFIDRQVPAVHLFTEPHSDYHRPSDTAGKVDLAGLVKVAGFAREGVVYLAERPNAMTSTLAGAKPAPSGAGVKAAQVSGIQRRVTLGTVPDFGFAGPGVRIAGVTPGSPAESAGLREGDIIVGLDGQPVTSLKEYSDRLRTLVPGKVIAIAIVREQEELSLQVTPVSR